VVYCVFWVNWHFAVINKEKRNKKMLAISRIKKMMTVLTLALGVSVFAFDWTAPFSGPKGQINTLVLTANYKPPLILVQLLMASNRQPYVQVPNSKEGKDSIYFFPAGKNAEGAAADGLQVLEKDLKRFIRFVNPKQVMVVGDKRYVAEKYIKMIDKKIPIIIIKGGDWQRIAASVGSLFDIPTLADDYKRIYKKWQDSYPPTRRPVKVKEEFDSVTEISSKGVLEVKESAKIEEVTEPAAGTEKKVAGADVKIPVKSDDSVKEPEAKTPAKAPVLIKD
jgi:hypothetical protein